MSETRFVVSLIGGELEDGWEREHLWKRIGGSLKDNWPKTYEGMVEIESLGREFNVGINYHSEIGYCFEIILVEEDDLNGTIVSEQDYMDIKRRLEMIFMIDLYFAAYIWYTGVDRP